MTFLKADTAVDVIVGPALDKTDGVTPETALTVASIDFDMYKGSTLQTRTLVASGATGTQRNFVHSAKGMWTISLTTADVDTEGILRLYFEYAAEMLPFWEDFTVVNANVYDSLFAAATTDYLQVDTIQVTGTGQTANDNGADINAILIDTTGLNGDVMRGTDNAALASALTTHDGKLDTVDTVVDGIQTDLSNATDGLGALKALIDALNDLSSADIVAAFEDSGLALVTTTIATLASQTSFTLTAGSADNNAYVGCMAVIEDVSTSAQKAIGLISAYTGATKTVTLIADPGIFTMATTDKIRILPIPKQLPAALADGAGGLPISDAGGLDVDTKLANTNEITTARMGALTDWINGGRLDLLLDAIPTTAMRGTDGANTTVPDAAGVAATPADVNAQVLDVLNVDTFAEPGQETPAATTTLVKKIGYLYKFLRNKVTNDGTNIKVYNDAGSVVDQKNTVSEAAGTVTRGKFGTGP